MSDTTRPQPAPRWIALIKRAGMFALKWGGLGVALLVTAALSGYFSMRQAVRGGEVLVPVVEGMALEEAEQALRKVGLILQENGERTDEQVPAGRILVQVPAGGAKLKQNRKVRVVFSLGREVLKVPPLVGQPARRAQIALQQSGLRVGGIAYTHDDSQPGDRILAQEPPPGARRMREGSVRLLVSKGKRPRVWVMPLVEGRQIARAARLFADEGFRVGNVRREYMPGVPPGVVIRQYPRSGYPLSEGDSISLVVSTESELDE